MRLLLLAFLLGAVLSYTTAYRDTEDFRDDNEDDDLINSLEEMDELNDDSLPESLENEQEYEDPAPFRMRIRTRRFRRAVRRVRVRVRLRRLKCPLRCTSYYTCLAKASGIAKLFCSKLKKGCRC